MELCPRSDSRSREKSLPQATGAASWEGVAEAMETAIRQAFPEAQKTAQVAPPPVAQPGHRSATRAPDAYGRSAAQERHRLRSGGRLLSWDGPPPQRYCVRPYCDEFASTSWPLVIRLRACCIAISSLSVVRITSIRGSPSCSPRAFSPLLFRMV